MSVLKSVKKSPPKVLAKADFIKKVKVQQSLLSRFTVLLNWMVKAHRDKANWNQKSVNINLKFIPKLSMWRLMGSLCGGKG